MKRTGYCAWIGSLSLLKMTKKYVIELPEMKACLSEQGTCGTNSQKFGVVQPSQLFSLGVKIANTADWQKIWNVWSRSLPEDEFTDLKSLIKKSLGGFKWYLTGFSSRDCLHWSLAIYQIGWWPHTICKIVHRNLGKKQFDYASVEIKGSVFTDCKKVQDPGLPGTVGVSQGMSLCCNTHTHLPVTLKISLLDKF